MTITTTDRAGMLLRIALLVMLLAGNASAGELLLDEFNTLEAWEPFYFRNIGEHSQYSIANDPVRGNCLYALSNSSASALRLRESFDIYQYPNISWQWRIEGVLEKGDATRKSGDDYPIRIYVVFAFDPDEAGFGERLKYGALKTLYGQYPPHSSLNYIWANRQHEAQVLISPYTDRARMIALRSGGAQAGQWVGESVNVIEDYRRAFGEDPPREASVAIMSDSDNTRGSAGACVDSLRIWGP